MSSALQPAPLQPTSISALNTPPLVASPSPNSRLGHYPSAHSSPARDAHQQYTTAAASSSTSSSGRPSRRPSAADSNSPMSSRAALASPVPVPVHQNLSAASHDQNTPSSHRKHNAMPTAVPPRTSSTQHSNGGSGSRRATQSSGRDPNGSSSTDHRRTHHVAQEPHRASASRDNRSGATSSARSPPAMANSSKGPSREASEILNSILISQPEVDIDRERERLELAQPHHISSLQDDDAAPPPIVANRPPEQAEEARRGARSRHDHSKREKHTKFGEYILGNTIGEGEFGKVKLGWKQDGGVQVAIKLIKKDQLGSKPERMAKIMREVAILKQLTHPNIVRLHKMEESERHYGIVLEYASGGELFDYILNHRYLKDNSARRLFAQLVSGVGYLHKKGIVHRDLKLENLLLDRNRNIIITDFGFANTFDPNEELTEEEEQGLPDREFVKRAGLDRVKPSGSRKGDLMQTSCGSPCYAAPELVVSDSLYTGRKVDVWSCGVILYAMLAGYLPFDDDPANPEGDNINLLYKYIVNTPLTFPEYVSPHARDLLRRILVPNPRKRADLFEVARHSWLSEYAHVVEFITSSTTTPGEIQNTTVPAEDEEGNPMIARSSSVRESSKRTAVSPPIGGLVSKQGTVDAEAEAAYAKQQKDNKRRTVQVEYVPPNTTTQRGESSAAQPSTGRTRARSGSQGPVELVDNGPTSSPSDKPLPRDPPVSKDVYEKPASSSRRTRASQAPPQRTGRDPRETAYITSGGSGTGGRPATGGSMGSMGRGSYGQPAPPEVADTNAHGRIQQPPRTSSKGYGMQTGQEQESMEYGRPSISVPTKFARISGFSGEGEPSASAPPPTNSGEHKGHKRSSTLGEISTKLFGRSGSLFGGRKGKRDGQAAGEKSKRYPPVSMNNSMPGGEEPRVSMDSKRSRRSFSIGLGKKRSGSMTGSHNSQERQQNRRFSFIPGSLSLKAIGIGKDDNARAPDSQQDLPIQDPPTHDQYGRRYIDQDVDRHQVEAATIDGMYAQLQGSSDTYPGQPPHQVSNQYGRASGPDVFSQGTALNTGSDPSNERRPPGSAPYSQSHLQDPILDARRVVTSSKNPGRGVLQKHKRLSDAYEQESSRDHSGSSGGSRKVMDWFRRRGKARLDR